MAIGSPMQNVEPTLAFGIVISDNAIREEGTGKLSFIGSFQNFNFPTFPFQSPPFFVTAFITNLAGQIDKLTITARVEQPKSGHVVRSSSIEIGFKKPIDKDEIFEIPFGLPPCIFPAAGVYQIVVLVNNEKVGHRDFRVNPITNTPQIQ